MLSVTSLLSCATFRVLYSPLFEIKFPARVLILNFNPKIWASLGLSVTCITSVNSRLLLRQRKRQHFLPVRPKLRATLVGLSRLNQDCPLVFGRQFCRFAFSPLPRAIEGEARFKRRCTSSCIFFTHALLTKIVRSR